MDAAPAGAPLPSARKEALTINEEGAELEANTSILDPELIDTWRHMLGLDNGTAGAHDARGLTTGQRQRLFRTFAPLQPDQRMQLLGHFQPFLRLLMQDVAVTVVADADIPEAGQDQEPPDYVEM